MPGSLRDEVTSRFPWLFNELGFRITAHDDSPQTMGSGIVALESDSLRLRFVNDRGGIYVEVTSTSQPQRWFEVGFLWHVLTGDRPTPQLDGWAWFLRDHIRELTEALGPRFATTNDAVLRRERENQVTLSRYQGSFQPTFMGIPARFYRGQLGWIVAGVLLILLVAK
jgi:hypothetical protein